MVGTVYRRVAGRDGNVPILTYNQHCE